MALSDGLVEYWPLTSASLTGSFAGNVLTATNASYEPSAPGPCWKIDTSSSGYLICTSLTLSEPFTIAVMVYVNGGASGSGFTFAGYLKGSADYWQLYQDNSNNLLARARHSGAAGDASGGGVTGSAFNNCAAVYTSSTSRQAYLATTLGTAETTSVSVSGASANFTLGALYDGAVVAGANQNWRFKHAAVWSRALSDAELDSYFADPASVLGAAATAGKRKLLLGVN